MEALEQAAAAKTPLLRVQSEGSGGLLLTFEAGCVRIAVDSTGSSVVVEVADEERRPVADLAEEEPWWRLLGVPLCGAQRLENEESPGVALQFRDPADAQRVVEIRSEDGRLAAELRREASPAR
jgi:hypothetical protein